MSFPFYIFFIEWSLLCFIKCALQNLFPLNFNHLNKFKPLEDRPCRKSAVVVMWWDELMQQIIKNVFVSSIFYSNLLIAKISFDLR